MVGGKRLNSTVTTTRFVFSSEQNKQFDPKLGHHVEHFYHILSLNTNDNRRSFEIKIILCL